MADIDLDRDRNRTTGSRTGGRTAGRDVKVYDRTETRRSYLTTEFWLSLAMAVALIVAGYVDEDGLPVDMAWALAAGVIAFYTLSRGIAKAGSSDPEIYDVDMQR